MYDFCVTSTTFQIFVYINNSKKHKKTQIFLHGKIKGKNIFFSLKLNLLINNGKYVLIFIFYYRHPYNSHSTASDIIREENIDLNGKFIIITVYLY